MIDVALANSMYAPLDIRSFVERLLPLPRRQAAAGDR